MNIALIGLQEVDNIWSSIAEHVVKCLKKTPSYYSAGELWQMCRSGQAFLLLAHEGTEVRGAAIWQFQTAYGQTVFTCLMLAGKDMGQWTVPMLESARSIARDGGAKQLSATSRVGLVQTLKKQIPGLKVVRQSYLVEV